ncbi:MAG: hypothetical protein WBC99_03895, partial [Candidatus Omnitrophota bacterium]
FQKHEGRGKREKAHKLLRQNRREILNYVALWTGEKKFIINDLLKDLIERSRELNLEASHDKEKAILETSVYVTAQIMNYLYTGKYRRKK